MNTVIGFQEKKAKGILSAPFNPDLLDDAIIAYDNRADRLKLPSGQTLKGIRFDRADIESLFANANVTHLYLRFIESPVGDYVTILAGGSVPTVANPNGEVDRNNLYDYCEPCPVNCAVFV